MNGNLISNIMFQKYIFVLGVGIILGGMIYFMDYKKISQYSLLIYGIGIILNIISSISDDLRCEFLYVVLPFYTISFAGFLKEIEQNKRNVIKTIFLGIISIVLLRRIGHTSARFVTIAYLIMGTIKILKQKRNRIKWLAVIWAIPVIITGIYTYQAINYNEEIYWMGLINRKK